MDKKPNLFPYNLSFVMKLIMSGVGVIIMLHIYLIIMQTNLQRT